MGSVFAMPPSEEHITHESEPGDFRTEVKYPDGTVYDETIGLTDNLKVEMVKKSLLDGRGITNFQDYSLVAVHSNHELVLPDDEAMAAHLNVLVTEGNGSYLEIRLR